MGLNRLVCVIKGHIWDEGKKHRANVTHVECLRCGIDKYFKVSKNGDFEEYFVGKRGGVFYAPPPLASSKPPSETKDYGVNIK